MIRHNCIILLFSTTEQSFQTSTNGSSQSDIFRIGKTAKETSECLTLQGNTRELLLWTRTKNSALNLALHVHNLIISGQVSCGKTFFVKKIVNDLRSKGNHYILTCHAFLRIQKGGLNNPSICQIKKITDCDIGEAQCDPCYSSFRTKTRGHTQHIQ